MMEPHVSGSMILAIETSNPSATPGAPCAGVAVAALAADGSIRDPHVEWLQTVGRHEDDLMPAIDRLTRRLGLGGKDFSRIAVSIGPGGYTGLRVAVTTANLIAATSGAAVIGVPTAEALARRTTGPSPVGVCLGVKADSFWIHVFPDMRDGKLVRTSDLQSLPVRTLVADGFLPPAARDWAEQAGIAVESPRYDPVAVAEVAAGKPTSAAPVLPLYAREPEAVTRWRLREK